MRKADPIEDTSPRIYNEQLAIQKGAQAERRFADNSTMRTVDVNLYLERLSQTGVLEIMRAEVARRGVLMTEIFSRDQTAHIASARAELMLIVRERLGWSYPAIGKLFGRDHTTVIIACRKAEAERKVRGK